MTKRREPLTYHHALTVIAARIGWDRCAAILGKTERMVRYLSDPDCEVEIRLLDAERLDKAFLADGGDHAPFQRLYALRLDIASSAVADPCLVALAGDASKENGEAVAALLHAAQNSRDPVARRNARQETQEAIDKLTDGLAALDRQEAAEAAAGG